jgi:hypothetical protein
VGVKLATARKNVYYDGHEREDVVKYRREWAKRMMEYKKSMDVFTGDENHPIIPSMAKSMNTAVLRIALPVSQILKTRSQKAVIEETLVLTMMNKIKSP